MRHDITCFAIVTVSKKYFAMTFLKTCAFIVLAISILNSKPASAEASVTHYCFSNTSESCQIIIEGKIENGLTQRLETLINEIGDTPKIFFNSSGGSLGEALRLGRYIRSLNVYTLIGGTDGLKRLPDGTFDFPPREMRFQDGQCSSACAYAFLGGSYRSLGFNGKLGFHRFRSLTGDIGDGAAQAISAQLLSYLIEMGVDARIFILAAGESANSMYYVSETEAETFDLITPRIYSSFFLEPYKEGVIAAAKKAGTTDRLDFVTQVSAFCRRGKPYLLFFAPKHRLHNQEIAGLRFQSMEYYHVFPSSNNSLRVNASGAFLTLKLDRKASMALTSTNVVNLSFLYNREVDGYYGAQLRPSDMDHEMLKTAFKFCIN